MKSAVLAVNRWIAGVLGSVLMVVLVACGTPPSALIDERYSGVDMDGDPALGSARQFARHAVAADHPEASQAGAEMLARGGNAVDAAVATSFALSVVRPDSCGIGGGGFMLVHLAKENRTIVIDYRERAPAGASPEMFEGLPEDASKWSGKAVAVPGTVKGLLHALDKYGTLHRRTVLAPAIRLARLGSVYDRHMERSCKELAAFIDANPARCPEEASAMRDALALGHPPRPIDDNVTRPKNERDLRELSRSMSLTEIERAPRLRNAAQAEVLERIAAEGESGFYAGPVGEAIVAAVNRHGGGLTLQDLAGVEVREAAPLVASWRGRTIQTMPLPSSGGVTLVETLALMDRVRPHWEPSFVAFKAWLEDSRFRHSQRDDPLPPPPDGMAPYAHALAESFKHAFADRAQYLGDPAFMAADPTARLLDPARLDEKARLIDATHTLPDGDYANAGKLADLVSSADGLPEDHGTSHFSVVDQWGNAVACTETINLGFGSRIFVKEFGFFLNNQMDDFQTRRGRANAFGLVQSDRNLPQPGKCPLSSMSPTIVLGADGRVETVVGASGGPRIISGVVQSLLFADDFGIGVAAVDFPRLHHQWKPATVRIEPAAIAWAYANAGSFGDRAYFDPEKLQAAGDEVLTDPDDKVIRPIVEALRAKGHDIKPMFEGAAVQMIRRDPAGGWTAASDPRKGGAPAGE